MKKYSIKKNKKQFNNTFIRRISTISKQLDTLKSMSNDNLWDRDFKSINTCFKKLKSKINIVEKALKNKNGYGVNGI